MDNRDPGFSGYHNSNDYDFCGIIKLTINQNSQGGFGMLKLWVFDLVWGSGANKETWDFWKELEDGPVGAWFDC